MSNPLHTQTIRCCLKCKRPIDNVETDGLCESCRDGSGHLSFIFFITLIVGILLTIIGAVSYALLTGNENLLIDTPDELVLIVGGGGIALSFVIGQFLDRWYRKKKKTSHHKKL